MESVKSQTNNINFILEAKEVIKYIEQIYNMIKTVF